MWFICCSSLSKTWQCEEKVQNTWLEAPVAPCEVAVLLIDMLIYLCFLPWLLCKPFFLMLIFRHKLPLALGCAWVFEMCTRAWAAGVVPGICFSSPVCQLQAPCWVRNCRNTHPFISRQMSTLKGVVRPLVPVCVLRESGVHICYDEIPCSQTDWAGLEFLPLLIATKSIQHPLIPVA